MVDTYRLQTDNDNSQKEQYVSYLPLQNVPINVQVGGPEDIVIADGAFGQTYVAFTTYSGILSGDKLVDQKSGEAFIVKGKSNWMTPTLAPHIELLLVQFETTE